MVGFRDGKYDGRQARHEELRYHDKYVVNALR